MTTESYETVFQALNNSGMHWTTSKQLAGDIDMSTKEIGFRLKELEDDGVVERYGGQSPYQWRVDL